MTVMSKGAPKGNQFARKPDEEKRTSQLWFRCTRAEKAKLVHEADGQKLSDFIRRKLGLDDDCAE